MSEHDTSSIEGVEAYAAANGIALSPNDKKRIAAAQRAERERLQSISVEDNTTSWADRWHEFYPKLLDAIVSAGNTVMTFSQTFIVNLGVPVVLVLLLIVEQRRVVHGIELFEFDSSLAAFAAWALVMLNLTLEMQVHYIEHAAGYVEDRQKKRSLRLWARNMAYRIGWGDDWKEQELSPAQRYRGLLRLVTFTILALALAGSMRGVIEQETGPWYEAIVSIFTESTLLEMTTWLGGLLFAMAAVLAAQGLSRYVAIRCVEILSQMESDQHNAADPHAADVERAGASVALAIIEKKLSKKRENEKQDIDITPVETAKDNPLAGQPPQPVTYSNGNHT